MNEIQDSLLLKYWQPRAHSAFHDELERCPFSLNKILTRHYHTRSKQSFFRFKIKNNLLSLRIFCAASENKFFVSLYFTVFISKKKNTFLHQNKKSPISLLLDSDWRIHLACCQTGLWTKGKKTGLGRGWKGKLTDRFGKEMKRQGDRQVWEEDENAS